MAYPVRSSTVIKATAGTAFTATLPAHDTDDLLVVLVFSAAGATDITTATVGWTKHGTFGASAGSRGGFFSKLAASGSETSPVFDGGNGYWLATIAVVKDQDTAVNVEVVSSRLDYSAGTITGPAITTATDNALVLYGFTTGAAYSVPQASPTQLVSLDGTAVIVSGYPYGRCGIAYTVKGAAGAVTQPTFIQQGGSGGNMWAVSIKNKTSGSTPPTVGGEIVRIDPLTTINACTAGSIVSPDTVAASINSITCDTLTSVSISGGDVYAPDSNHDEKAYQLQGYWVSATGQPKWSGPVLSLTSVVDIDGEIINLSWATTANAASVIGASGVIVIMADSSKNYEAFAISSAEQFSSSSMYNLAFNPSAETATYSSGTVDYADIKYIGLLFHRTGDYRTYTIRGLYRIPGKIGHYLTGGGENSPINAQAIYKACQGFAQGWSRAPKQGAAQLLLTNGIQLGDGSTPSFVRLSGASVEFPIPSTAATATKQWWVQDNAQAIQIYASASDTMDFRGTLFGTTAPMDFTLHASSSTDATYYWNGLAINGPWDVTWKTGITAQSITFTGCDEINFKGANVAGCYIQKTASTDAAIAFDASGATVSDTTIDVTGTSAAYHIELGASVESVTLTDVTFTGTPGTDKIHVKKTSGTCTITISGTTTLAAGEVTTDGATVAISAPELYQSVTISGCRENSRIQLLDENSGSAGEELYNDIPDAFPFTWTDPAPAAVERSIRLRIAYYDDSNGLSADIFEDRNIGTCGLTAGTAHIPYNHEPEEDPTYLANATDGSAVLGIVVDDTLLRCRIAVGAITWAEIYAYNVYWLWTEEGIRDEGAYIDAPDPANYLVHDFKIINDTDPEIPLVISGGYGRSADTGTIADIIDTTGGSIFPQVDHVVSYATGDGPLTTPEKAQLSAIYSGVSNNLDAKVSDTAQPGDEMTLTAAYNAAKTAAQAGDAMTLTEAYAAAKTAAPAGAAMTLTNAYNAAKTAAAPGAAMTLTEAYDPAKTAAQAGDAMTLTEAYAAAKTAAQPDDIPAAATNASAVRTELTSELAKIVDIHRIKGLDAAHPVTATGDGLTSKTVSADGIEIEITTNGIERTV